MDRSIILKSLTNEQDVQKLRMYLRELYEMITPIETLVDPNGTIDGKIKGRLALYYDGADYFLCVCVDGATTWLRTVALI